MTDIVVSVSLFLFCLADSEDGVTHTLNVLIGHAPPVYWSRLLDVSCGLISKSSDFVEGLPAFLPRKGLGRYDVGSKRLSFEICGPAGE